MEFIQPIDNTLNNVLDNFVKKPTIVRGIVHLLLILYATKLAPSLPQPVLDLFDNAYFKLFIFSLILWTAQFSPSTSILIALGFMMSMNYVNKKPLWEFLDNVSPDASATMAPSKDVAIATTSAAVQQQTTSAPVVQAVAQKPDTIVVQPSIINTPQGPAVVNPSVVVAPAVVSTPSGQTVVVKPDVTIIPSPTPAATTAAPAVAPEPSSSAASVPAPAPSTPAPSASEPAPTPAAQMSGCYPQRHVDVEKLGAYEASNKFGDMWAEL